MDTKIKIEMMKELNARLGESLKERQAFKDGDGVKRAKIETSIELKGIPAVTFRDIAAFAKATGDEKYQEEGPQLYQLIFEQGLRIMMKDMEDIFEAMKKQDGGEVSEKNLSAILRQLSEGAEEIKVVKISGKGKGEQLLKTLKRMQAEEE